MKFSIRSKIAIIAGVAALPFLITTIYLLSSMKSYGRAYDKIVSNMTIANNYNISFKEEIDESCYKLVVGYATFEELEQAEIGATTSPIKNPYTLINELRDEFTALGEESTQPETKMWIESLLRNIDVLENNIKDIEESVKVEGQYQQNIEKLDNNIYILTDLIQEDIQYYIYYETQNMEGVNEILTTRIEQFLRLCILGVIAIIILVIALILVLTSGFFKPIKELNHATREMAKGNFDARADVHSNDEIEELANEFNLMAENMQGMIDQIKVDENKMRQADLRLLQEQINPHFLYNTLDTIVWLIEADEPQQAVDMVVTLSNFFRLVLSKGKESITIREEEQHIKSYLEIQQVRYHDILEYEINIDRVLYEYKILKLTLQPLVENALYHGIKYKRAKGRIYICGEKVDDMIIFTVQDDGVGMDPEELSALRDAISKPCQETEKGFGLANVNERLHMNYGPQYGLFIESSKNKGISINYGTKEKYIFSSKKKKNFLSDDFY